MIYYCFEFAEFSIEGGMMLQMVLYGDMEK